MYYRFQPPQLVKTKKRDSEQKKELEPFLFADDIILYIDNPKESTHTQITSAINELSRFAGYKINVENIYTLAMNNQNLRKYFHVLLHQKEEKTQEQI